MNFKKIIACVAALSICLTGFGQSIDRGLISDIVSAETSTEVEGLHYKVLDNGTIEILLSSGEDEIVIPETIDGLRYKVLDNGTIEILLSSVEDEIVIPETIDGKKLHLLAKMLFGVVEA